MLQRTTEGVRLIEHAFLVAIEVQEGGPTHEQIELKLADSVAWVEGVGRVDVNYLGEMEVGEDAI